MPNQIVLSWDVSVANSPFGSVQAAAALAAVELYQNTGTDPVLGQFFGLSVATDATTQPDAATARRTLTLNMFNSDTALPAPPPFPCHPRTSTPPELPYPLREARTLSGSFFVTNGLMTVQTSLTQERTLAVGDVIQFAAQQGVFYEVAVIAPTSFSVTAAYTGVTGNSAASIEVAAPATRVAIFSTSDLDTNGVATEPAIAAGPGARTVLVAYTDSDGNSDSVTVSLTGRRPAAITLAPGTVDMVQIDSMTLVSVGDFENSVGQITLVELSDDLPAMPAGLPIGTGVGATQAHTTNPLPIRTFKSMTDEAQLLIDRHLAYMPPSYFALSNPTAATPALEGDFFVTTGSSNVPTVEDQTGALAAGDVIEFAAQPGTRYTLDQVTPRSLTLTAAYTGIDTNDAGVPSNPNVNAGTLGNLGTSVTKKPTAARLLVPLVSASPTNAELATPLAQFVAPETAAPPPAPPGFPSTVPLPTFLSGMFTRTLQLALAGVPVTPRQITFV